MGEQYRCEFVIRYSCQEIRFVSRALAPFGNTQVRTFSAKVVLLAVAHSRLLGVVTVHYYVSECTILYGILIIPTAQISD